MAKYSTGGIGGDSGGSCELCGKETSDLRTANVAGAQLDVCDDCARHDEDSSPRSDGHSEGRDRRRRAAQNTARVNDARKGNPEHWEKSGTDYEDDQLPYLVSGYGERLEAARQEAGLQPAELAGELGVTEADVVAVEQGRATRAGIGGSLIRDLEERLNVQLVERED